MTHNKPKSCLKWRNGVDCGYTLWRKSKIEILILSDQKDNQDYQIFFIHGRRDGYTERKKDMESINPLVILAKMV